MPIRPPALDDRRFDDLVAELVARIPAHTPEWTHPRAGDPGRTLIELFAWLGDTILYRANLIPERQRLAFLRLLGMPLKPAQPARGMVSLLVDDERNPTRVDVAPGSLIEKPVPFQTTVFATAFPLLGQPYLKRVLGEAERAAYQALLPDLTRAYSLQLQEEPVAYVTTPAFEHGAMNAAGVDIIGSSVDGTLWIALMAPSAKLMKPVRESLRSDRPLALNVGVALAYEMPGLSEELGVRAQIPLVWRLSSGKDAGEDAEMLHLEVLQDGTRGLSRHGIVRLALPRAENIGAPVNDPRQDVRAGVGARPPRVDNPEDAERLVAWLSLSVAPGYPIETLKLAWAGINAVDIEQLETLGARALGASDGGSDQVFDLAVAARGSVDGASLGVEVHDPTNPQTKWVGVDDLGSAGPLDCVYRLDPEAGTIGFGDGVHGRVPARGAEIVVRNLRVGGGVRGNLPPDSIARVDSIVDLVTGNRKKPQPALKVVQGLPTQGGSDAETVAGAERRIPSYFRHKDRAVTVEDYRLLARQAPGAEVGRVEVLPRFKPHERQSDVPGVLSVMVLPARASVDFQPPCPRADRPLLETVHAFLDSRRPLATELYVIGCAYKPLGVSVAVQIRDGHAREQVLVQVRLALRRYLWPLPLGTGGAEGDWSESVRSDGGYPLGRRLTDRELEVVVARVPGVAGVSAVNVFAVQDGRFVDVGGPGKTVSTFTLETWELPELSALVVIEGTIAPSSVEAPYGRGAGRGAGTGPGGVGTGPGGVGIGPVGTGPGSRDPRREVAVPVVPGEC